MAFDSKIESAAIASKTDFNGVPSCKCGNQSIIALATVVNKNTGAIKVGAASEFCGRPNKVLLDWYSLLSFDGFCIHCWDGRGEEGRRTYSDDMTRKAWQWFIGYMAKDSDAMSGIFKHGDNLTLDQQEEFIEVVNREAKRCNIPSAIPDEYKLTEVWG